MDDKFEKYEAVYKGFTLFFDQHDFVGMLALKADYAVMNQLLNKKADFTSMENFEHNIQELNNKINHLIIFQNEMLTKTLNP